MRKRILIVGAGYHQLPLIQLAKKEGHYVITSDYLPDNPGHALADECHNISIKDELRMLVLAKNLKVDGVATLSSDMAIATVAYVTQHLGLPGPSIESIATLTRKDLFRQALKKIGANTPTVYPADGKNAPDNLVASSKYIVKPVDSSGSRGVILSNGGHTQMEAAIQHALEFSSTGRAIVEDYIEGPQVNADGFLVNGQLVHFHHGDHVFFTGAGSCIPISTRWPSRHTDEVINQLKVQTEQITREVGYLTGPLNIEARITKDQKLYLVEIGPRTGGNFAAITLERLTGFNYVKGVLDYALGKLDLALVAPKKPYASPGASFILHASEKGIYAGLKISPEIKKKIFFQKEFKRPGDVVESYTGLHTSFGVVLLEFNSILERDEIMNKIQRLIGINLKTTMVA